MKNKPITLSYTKEHIITLNEKSQNLIAEALYGTFLEALNDEIEEVAEELPHEILKTIFINIVNNMDDEFWEG